MTFISFLLGFHYFVEFIGAHFKATLNFKLYLYGTSLQERNTYIYDYKHIRYDQHTERHARSNEKHCENIARNV